MEKYRKLEIAGRGSFGHAVVVQNIQDRKIYIMKIIDVSKMDRKQKEEALNEVHVLKAMRHPYIVTYRESFMDKRCLCIVMDYADGGDIYKKIAQQKKLGKGFPEDQILDWFVQTCLAMKHVHDRKILHRDLKTQNIFLTAKGDVKIGDFGIARVLQHTYDCAKTAIGTPYYLSPEICQEKPYNQKSDIWSLGCILYELVTLKHAFDANSMKGLVLKILRGVYPSIPSHYSQNLKDLIAEMLQLDPNKRPSIKKILEKDFLNERIPELFQRSIVMNGEFGKSVMKPLSEKCLPPVHNQQNKEEKERQNEAYRKLKEKERARAEKDRRKYESSNGSSSGDRSDRSRKYEGNENVYRNSKPNSSSNSFDRGHEKSDPTTKTRDDPDQKRLQRKPSIEHREEHKQEESKYSISSSRGSARGDNPGYSGSSSGGGGDKSRRRSSRKGDENDDNGDEVEEQRVYARFLTPEGKALRLPGVSDQDTVGYRIEALRVYLEQQLTVDKFLQAYNFLIDPPHNDGDEDDDTTQLQNILGPERTKFIPLIYQMIVCEDAYYGQNQAN